jgi:hypothetical protein
VRLQISQLVFSNHPDVPVDQALYLIPQGIRSSGQNSNYEKALAAFSPELSRIGIEPNLLAAHEFV